ncbi:MAG: GTPase Era [Rickettsiales bacterium]
MQNNSNLNDQENNNLKHIVVSIIGEPNSGKSTLLNNILGQKLSAVTHKAQTTRNVINGITIYNDTQIMFLDTPGIFEAKRSVDQFIVKEAWQTIKNADLVIVLFDINKELPNEVKKVLSYLQKIEKDFLIAINKCDKLEFSEFAKNNIIKLEEEANNILKDDTKIFKISALLNNFNHLLKYIEQNAKHTGWIHNEDEITTLPLKFLAQEITREKIMLYAHDEIPYNIIVETENFEQKNNECKIHQVIKVISQSHKKIILGKKGEKIKTIGQKARLELEQIYGYKVHLFLHIQVRPNFMKHDSVFDIKI